MQEIRIDTYTAGGRLDKALKKYLDKASPGFVYKMLRKKNILLNDKKATGSELLQQGDVIKLYLADDTIAKFHTAQQKQRILPAFSSRILYEDENLIALNKPAGILSQKAEPEDLSINEMLSSYLGSSTLFTPGISNRLDRNTSGIILAGKNPAAVRCLNDAIRTRTLAKWYLCIVKGTMSGGARIKGYLAKENTTNTVRVLKQIPQGQEAHFSYVETYYHAVSSSEEVSLLLVDLITGRSHQIRSHLAFIGHPIIGDTKYGDPVLNNRFLQKYGLRNQILHAWQVRFGQMEGVLEYMNGKSIICEIPDLFQNIMKEETLCLHGVPGAFGAPNSKPSSI